MVEGNEFGPYKKPVLQIGNIMQRNIAYQTLVKDQPFFKNYTKKQWPQILWIGCSDSRVPETQIMGLHSGDVFVQRNIANLVNKSDSSMMAVIEYAVNHLCVEMIIVCGRTTILPS